MTGVLRVPVFVENWQIECCGDPPGVGDRVEWVLVLVADQPDAPASVESAVTLDALATPFRFGDGDGAEFGGPRIAAEDFPTGLHCGDLHVFWSAPGTRSGPVRVRGRLFEEHHGSAPERFPRTVGTVARVRVVTQEYVPSPTEERLYLHGDAPPRYRDVPRSPTRFAGPPEEDGPYWAESGVLVDLEIPGAA